MCNNTTREQGASVVLCVLAAPLAAAASSVTHSLFYLQHRACTEYGMQGGVY